MTGAETQSDERSVVEQAALRLLAAREHSRRELRTKLCRRCSDGDLIDEVLAGLEAGGLLSERRFVEAYVEQRLRRGYGPLRIRAELAERGIADVLAEPYLSDEAADWRALMLTLAERRFGSEPAADRRELGRRARFLEQRGFPAGLVMRYLDRARTD